MAISLNGCSVCGRRFEVQHGFQVQSLHQGVTYYCSQGCHEADLFKQRRRCCSQCGKEFDLIYAFQQVSTQRQVSFFCSTACRELSKSPAVALSTRPEPARIAILNQKGGTGKTTTAVNLAGGLADAGYSVLLLDLDAQGHVATSLGAKTNHGIYQLLLEGQAPRMCITQLRKRLHCIVGDERLANVELWLANLPNDGRREFVLRDRIAPIEAQFDFIIADCGPAMSLMNINALTYADWVLTPVSCDFLSLVGVKQMLRTVKRVNKDLGSKVEILGVIPTFYDRRNRISDEAVKTLKSYFRDKVLPPIRINTQLKEAPQHEQTIFEYAPHSRGAADYASLVEAVVSFFPRLRHTQPPVPPERATSVHLS